MRVCRENIAYFRALASEPRLYIIELLTSRQMNLRELAEQLEMSVTIVSRHVKALESAGIISCVNTPSSRGLQKLCSLAVKGNLLEFTPESDDGNRQVYNIPIGNYVNWSASRPCGMASLQHVIGEVDDPRYFADPAHTEAQMIWLSAGYLEYAIPNYMTSRQRIKAIRFQMEICSEAPGFCEDWPSDIRFFVNGRDIGYWTCPGDFGMKKGLYTPEWLGLGSQYGLLKTLLVNSDGTFIDGNRISDVTVQELDLAYEKPIYFRIASSSDEKNAGGFNLFGVGFGNYDHGLRVAVEYDELVG